MRLASRSCAKVDNALIDPLSKIMLMPLKNIPFSTTCQVVTYLNLHPLMGKLVDLSLRVNSSKCQN